MVHDAFKGWRAIPDGVVDADEPLTEDARREAWEEAGVRVRIGDLLGMFAYSWPDRLLLAFAATPLEEATPAPVHGHEIDAAT